MNFSAPALLASLFIVAIGLVSFLWVRGKYEITKRPSGPSKDGLFAEDQQLNLPAKNRKEAVERSNFAVAKRDLPPIVNGELNLDKSTPSPKWNEFWRNYSPTKRENETFNSTGESGLLALARMPKEQLVKDQTAILISTYIEHMLSTGADEILVSEILHLVDSEQFTFNRKLAVGLASVIEVLGFGTAPDPRIHGVKPQTSGVIKVFPLAEAGSTAVAEEFHRVVVLVHLTSMVSKADKVVLESEKQLASTVIETNKNITPYERMSLQALFEWCFSNSFGYRGIKRNIGKLNHFEKLSVWSHLVEVAIVDKKLDVRELAELQKIYDVLGLNSSEKHIYLADVSNAILTAKLTGELSNSICAKLVSDNGARTDASPIEGTEEFDLDFEQDIDFETDEETDSNVHEGADRSWAGRFYVVDDRIHSLDGGEDFDRTDWFDTAIGK